MAERETRAATPVLLWKTRLLIAAQTFAFNCARRSNGTVNRRLINFVHAKASPTSKPINGVTSSDTTVDPSRNLWFRLYTPATTDDDSKLPVIVYFHGGGFVFFTADAKPYDDFCRRLAAELSAVVVSVNYRLAPEHRFPSQYDDGVDTLKFLDDAVLPPIADLGRCFVAGDSAGGNVAHYVTLRAATTDHDFKKLRIAGVIAMQPFFGGEDRTESEIRLTNVPFLNTDFTDWLWRAFLPLGSDRDHETSNINKSADISGVNFPATMVVIGGFDPLQDWQRRYMEWLKEAGKEAYLVEYPNAIHGFYWFPEFPESSLLIGEVRGFIQKQSSASN